MWIEVIKKYLYIIFLDMYMNEYLKNIFCENYIKNACKLLEISKINVCKNFIKNT